MGRSTENPLTNPLYPYFLIYGKLYLVGGFNHLDYFPFHIWNVILPIDELHHFSRWLLHHQSDIKRYLHHMSTLNPEWSMSWASVIKDSNGRWPIEFHDDDLSCLKTYWWFTVLDKWWLSSSALNRPDGTGFKCHFLLQMAAQSEWNDARMRHRPGSWPWSVAWPGVMSPWSSPGARRANNQNEGPKLWGTGRGDCLSEIGYPCGT